MSVNAACVRSSEGFYAIVINSGLITFYNKISKILAAMSHPKSIVYCSRTDEGDISTETLREWYLQITEHYRKTRVPAGPQILLRDPADGWHAFQLSMWERFILCHELGHFFCGHLENESKWHRDSEFGAFDKYEEVDGHEAEYEADIYGYLLLRRVCGIEMTASDADHKRLEHSLLAVISSLFDLSFLLGGTGSPSHPNSLTRILTVLNTIYGNQVADTLSESYRDDTKLEALSTLKLSTEIDADNFAKQCRAARNVQALW